MKIVRFEDIRQMNIPPQECIRWAREALCMKEKCVLPPKSVIRMSDETFLTSMPCLLPDGYYGVKVVSRYPTRVPAIQSDLLLYDSGTGELLALMDAVWITSMRTGAVAALSIDRLAGPASEYSFIGLGNTARATMLCLSALAQGKKMRVNLLAYKQQELSFMERFADCGNISFHVFRSVEEMISRSGVLISCITNADSQFAPDDAYPSGITVVPVHTRGFQNCDLFFDKVFADDTDHVRGFKHFDRFRRYDEFSNVLTGKNPGRESESERILVYNVGIAMHDIHFAAKIFGMTESIARERPVSDIGRKFWV